MIKLFDTKNCTKTFFICSQLFDQTIWHKKTVQMFFISSKLFDQTIRHKKLEKKLFSRNTSMNLHIFRLKRLYAVMALGKQISETYLGPCQTCVGKFARRLLSFFRKKFHDRCSNYFQSPKNVAISTHKTILLISACLLLTTKIWKEKRFIKQLFVVKLLPNLYT